MLKGTVAGAAMFIVWSFAANAAPAPALGAEPHVVLVSGGCGFDFHRNPFGVCVPNRVFVEGPRFRRLPPPCPRGYHRDPDPARPICYPNL